MGRECWPRPDRIASLPAASAWLNAGLEFDSPATPPAPAPPSIPLPRRSYCLQRWCPESSWILERLPWRHLYPFCNARYVAIVVPDKRFPLGGGRIPDGRRFFDRPRGIHFLEFLFGRR